MDITISIIASSYSFWASKGSKEHAKKKPDGRYGTRSPSCIVNGYPFKLVCAYQTK